MAPHGRNAFFSAIATWRPLHALLHRRSCAGIDLARQPSTDQAHQGRIVRSAASASASNNLLYLGIGAGVGGALLIAIVLVTIQIVRKRGAHRRAVIELGQQSEAAHSTQGQDVSEIPRPVSVARCGNLLPMHARAGWGALSSDETLHEPRCVGRKDKRKRNSISLPKRLKQRGIPLKRLKHLSAIIESPRSKGTKSPSPAVQELLTAPIEPTTTDKSGARKTVTMIHPAERDEDVFTAPGSPKPHVLPCFAIRSPGMYGAAIANEEQRPRGKQPRSVSTGALFGPSPEAVALGQVAPPSRPQLHSRSLSLGAPVSGPPTGPVPPVPVIAPHRTSDDDSNRQGLCVSRLSTSSQESASSSVLITSPILAFRDGEGKQKGSPSVEQLVADEDGAQLKSVKNRQWQNPRITGPRAMDQTAEATALSRNHASIRSNIARYSTDSLESHRFSAALSMDSGDIGRNRLSIPQIATADRMSISRVASYNSLKTSGSGGVQKITTPRRVSRQSSVSASGSPAERRRTSTLAPNTVLRDIQPNSVSNSNTPSRHASQSTQNSGRSSNGNPFQWDEKLNPSLPVVKPSALKGSPNAKGSKGHKRQNCVRISTLTPQILGPPPSRPTSPPVMCGIEEEPGSEETKQQRSASTVGFATSKQQRLSVGSLIQQQLRVQTLRASLTPSSPTLSTWNTHQEHCSSNANSNLDLGLSSRQNSESQLSVSPIARSVSRQSDRSSAFSIPSFPSPSKATMSRLQYVEQVVPEFSVSRPSTDEEPLDSSSPFALHCSPRCMPRQEVMLPSSPPLPVDEHKEYDPAWPAIPVPDTEYDPASPMWQSSVEVEPERSSPAYLPFAMPSGMSGTCSDDGHISPRTRPISYGGDLPDTPPCSPKTMPKDAFNTLFESPSPRATTFIRPQRSLEKLTSMNASAIMATIPEDPVVVGFPTGVPILPPPSEHSTQTTPMGRRQRAATLACDFEPLRPAPTAPSPLHITKHQQTSPQGPRSEPAKSVLKNAMALRRMNSEIDTTTRNSRRYTQMTREPSPLLPWIGSPDLSESCNDLFDFDFASEDVGAGAEQHDGGNDDAGRSCRGALDEIDMTDLDRRLDGALAGFDAGPLDSSATVSRASSVWEDSELFWARKPADIEFTAGNLGLDLTTPTKKAVPLPVASDALLATPVARLRMPVLGERRGSALGRTPRSLYDSDGFLNT